MQFLFQLLQTALNFFTAANNVDPQEATSFALLYGYPIASYVNLSIGIANTCDRNFMVNELCPHTQLANASFRDINRPNVDTLYSEALVDLSYSDVEVIVPEVPDGRFYVLPFYDLYGNNFANLGTVNASSPGRYLVTNRPARPGQGAGDENYEGYIYMPTVYGAIDLRIQVDNTSDAEYVASNIQNQFRISSSHPHRPIAPPLTRSLLTEGLSSNSAERILQLTARLSPFNPPEVLSDIPKVSATLRVAGIKHGRYVTPGSVNLTKAAFRAKALADEAGVDPERLMRLGNGWFTTRSSASGDFKSDYTMRARVAAYGYLQLVDYEALYPIYNPEKHFFSNESYLVTFQGKPDVVGFWSLTVYNSEEFLVPNILHRYALGDRSQLKYPDGQLVYGTDDVDSSKPFSILLQATDRLPPKNWTSNWLPTPATTSNSTEFQFTLRFYGPTKSLLNGDYVYPTVRSIPIV